MCAYPFEFVVIDDNRVLLVKGEHKDNKTARTKGNKEILSRYHMGTIQEISPMGLR